MKLTVFGYGMAGRDSVQELYSNDEGIVAQDVIVVERYGKESGYEPNKKVEKKWFRQITKIDVINRLVILCLPPFEMYTVLDKLVQLQFCGPLIIEKPGPLPAEKSAPLIETLKRNGSSIYISHQRQYSDHFIRAAELIHTKAIGEAKQVILRLQKWDFLTAGTHWMALTHSCFGAPINAVGCLKYVDGRKSRYGYEIEESGQMKVIHEDGTEVTWELGGQGSRSEFLCFGTSGNIELKVRGDELGRFESSKSTEIFKNYGKARARLIQSAYQRLPPKVGCNYEELQLYLQLFGSIKRV